MKLGTDIIEIARIEQAVAKDSFAKESTPLMNLPMPKVAGNKRRLP